MTSTTTAISAEETLNAIVARFPATLPVLHRAGLDTCCGGGLTLRDAAERHGLALQPLLEALREAAASGR